VNINDYPLWTAAITPMRPDGSVDYRSLETILRAQEEAGNALLILGSTGEALNLEPRERKEILDFVTGLGIRVPVMVGVGGTNLRETAAWIDYLNALPGLHAYLLVTPLYAKPGDHGQRQWFGTLLDRAARSAMLYNVPSRTGIALSHRAVQWLSGHPRLWAIKEASGSTEEFARYGRDAPSARLFSGDDALMPAFSALGAKGLVSVAANVWPEQTRKCVRQNLAGTFADHDLWDAACRALFSASNPIPVKALLARLGRIRHPVLRPPLSADDMTGMEALLAHHQKIAEWQDHG